VVSAKIASQAQAARHYQRQGCGEAGPVLRRLQEAMGPCAAATLEQLRGLEGSASAAWFDLLGRLLQPPWRFEQRSRRPPRDPVNALLSLGYTWLLWRTVARCEAEGLEVNLGGLHEYRPGRPSLACDLMEPLRVSAVDRWVLGLCNQGMIAPGDFLDEPDGVRLQEGRFGGMLRSWEQYLQDHQQESVLDGWVSELLVWLRQDEREAPADAV
jgi:CRISPR-associated protein Cas1